MALSDKLKQEQVPTHFGPRCTVWVIRESLSEEDRQAMDEAIRKIREARSQGLRSGQSGYNCRWLQEILVQEGHPISALTLQKHVRHQCSCGI